MVGASIGSGQALVKTGDRDKAVFGVAVYWGVFALLAVASTIAVAFAYEALVAFIYIILCAPAVQLVASVVALGVVAVSPIPNKGPAYAALGWIALWSFVGSAAGLAVMIALGTFGYQATTRANPVYAQYVPRTLRYVKDNLARRPRFARLGQILGDLLPELR